MQLEGVDAEQGVDRPAGRRLELLDAAVAELARAAKAPNTLRAYRSDLRHFTGWLADHGIQHAPVSPTDVARYLAACAAAGLKASTIQRRVAAISWLHDQLDLPPPTRSRTVTDVMAGIRNTLGTAPDKKRALTTDDILTMVDHTRTLMRAHPSAGPEALADSLARRDQVILLLGFAAGARRSELAALRIHDLTDHPDGLVITIRRSKGDQQGRGRRVGIHRHPTNPAHCPVATTRSWLAHLTRQSGLRPAPTGPLLRRIHRSGTVQRHPLTGETINRVITDRAIAAGITTDPTSIGGHSLRRGFITAASQAGAPLDRIADHVGHTDQNTTRGYRDDALVMDHSPARHLWDSPTA